ncbi:T9SS type A sorting domain-containing protein [Flavobacterium gyeonganense]|uniref:T9SS type A sorting domain-containing protein n=1 Tax=Flavobacterium gyeonganense TaxID=1310418 RepID=A0ABV5H7H2_9FLAO|nr:T9SS type A sorting domain-containing protein [Flavobacterium gyeonganense]
MRKNKLFIIILFSGLFFSLSTIAQTISPSQKTTAGYTAIIDANFEKALIALGLDSGPLDQQVLTANITNITSLNVSGKFISNLAGIEGFTSLKTLNCSLNSLKTLNLTQNLALTTLNCSTNSLTGLDLSQNIALEVLYSNSNPLITLDISKNLALTDLNCSLDQLSTLDVSKNIALKILRCESNRLTDINLSTNLALVNLNVSNNQITNLNLSKNIALQSLSCSNNRFVTLDLSKNQVLSDLVCNSSSLLKTINLKTGKNIPTFEIDCTYSYNLTCILVNSVAYSESNWIDKLEFSAKYNDVACYTYTAIPDVNFEKKLIALGIDKDGENGKVITENISSLTSLDVSYSNILNLTGIKDFAALTNLNCSGNALTGLDLSSNLSLVSLNCSINQLYSLDFSKNINLNSIRCEKNNLHSLNLKNGNNTKLTNLNLKTNPDLLCVLVDNVAYSNANWLAAKDNTTSYNNTACVAVAVYTLIPDAYFENKLIALGYDNDGKNGKILTSRISGITSLDVSSSSISNLAGIKDFVALKNLKCDSNRLTSLDLSNNIALIDLNVSSNSLGSLDVSKNVALINLNCNSNYIKNLDFSKNLFLKSLSCRTNNLSSLNLTQNFALTSLICGSNKLTTLDVSQNVILSFLACESNLLKNLDVSNNAFLYDLYCYSNQLTSLNTSKNPVLASLKCQSNKLTSLDLSKNAYLVWLTCEQNQLTNLDISKNLKISYLECSSNQLTSLDLSKHGNLEILYCGGNKLLNLNLKNGRNDLIKSYFSCSYNPNLTCILVDNAAAFASKWNSAKDATATYVDTSCTLYTSIPDVNFENKLISLGLDSGTIDGKVLTSNITKVTSLNVSSSSITNLTGIQDFVDLQELICHTNQLTDLDISKNTALTHLDCSSNQLSNLDISERLELTKLNCKSNKLTTLDVSQNVLLTDLNCSSNLISDLNLSENINLSTLSCNDNKLSNLNLKNRKNTLLINPNFNVNPSLTCILVDNSLYSKANWISNKDPQTEYNDKDCLFPYTLIPDTNFESKLIALGIDTDGKNGKVLTASIEKITSLDVSSGSIADLTGIENFYSLEILNCQNNRLKSLNVFQNSSLKWLNCYQNPLINIDLEQNTALVSLFCGLNQLTKLNVSNNINLTTLDCSLNNLTTLELSKNIALTDLNCSKNKLTSLDLSKNTNLKTFYGNNNNFANVDIRNGKNTLLSIVDFRTNPYLTCIKVDNATYSNSNWFDQKDSLAGYNESYCTIYTLIPDFQFEQALISLNLDDKYDGKVITNNIKDVTYLYINCYANGHFTKISDLTGIQDFTALKVLECSSNALTTLDLSKNIALTRLQCDSNHLMSLDISKNIALTNLDCSDNGDANNDNKGLMKLDVSKNIALTTLDCSSNSLASLDLSKNIALKSLICSTNVLPNLDVSNNTALTALDCTYNSLSSLDVSKNSVLTNLGCSFNGLSSLDVSKNSALIGLGCSSNQLKNLDVSKNAALTYLKCTSNQLTTLNVKNGFNKKVITFDATGNANLKCIEADSTTPPNTGWKKDATASYSITSCTLSNDTFEKNNKLVLIYPNPTNDILNIVVPADTELKKVEVFSLTGQKVETTTQSQISMKHLARGEYLFIIETNAGYSTKKVIKN